MYRPDVLKALKRVPFTPFRFHLSDGASFEVREPFHVQAELTQIAVGVDFDDEIGLPRRSVYLDPSHITRIEPIEGATAPTEGREGGNGQGGRVA